jgi:hypothetical protein
MALPERPPKTWIPPGHRLVRGALTCDQSCMDQGSASLPRLAILIDAENVAASCWPAASAIAARFGTAAVARAYFCHDPSPGWIGATGVEIVDGRPADGPNAADFLLAMDAAVMAAEGRVDGFVLITADDGFAAVAHGLKMRGASVYALIPFNGGPVARRLAAMADLAILVPMPPPTRVVRDPPSNDWQRHFHLALARCKADDEGWVALSDLGSELRAAGVTLPGGKLSGLARKASSVECQGSGTAIRVRRMNHDPPQRDPQEAPTFVASEASFILVDEDAEIPF